MAGRGTPGGRGRTAPAALAVPYRPVVLEPTVLFDDIIIRRNHARRRRLERLVGIRGHRDHDPVMDRIDLDDLDSRFRGQKIESICVTMETRGYIHLVLAADNDDGSSTLFKLIVEKE